MASLLERMIRREDAQAETLVNIASKLGSMGTALEGQQGQLDRLIRLNEEQTRHNQNLVTLMERSDENRRSAEEIRMRLAAAEDSIVKSKEAHAHNAGAIKALLWIVGATLPIGIIVVGFAYNTLATRIADVKETHAADKAEAVVLRKAISDDVRELQQVRKVQ